MQFVEYLLHPQRPVGDAGATEFEFRDWKTNSERANERRRERGGAQRRWRHQHLSVMSPVLTYDIIINHHLYVIKHSLETGSKAAHIQAMAS